MVSTLPQVFGTGPAGNMLGERQVFASLVTDLRHTGQLRGNDKIYGGAGADRLVGDDQIVLARSYVFDSTSMAKAEALTRGLLDVSDDFNDLVRRQYWVLDDFNDFDHDDTLVIDSAYTIGADALDGADGDDVLIGDDSVLVEPSFSVRVEHTDDFERFVEGVAEAGDELADAIFDLEHLDHHLRDVVKLVKHNNHWHEHVEHHTDVVLMGNDTFTAGAGNDLVIGDRFELRTVAVTVVPGGLPNRNSNDDAGKDSDWYDSSLSDWFDHNHWHGHDWHDHHEWQVPGVRTGSDTIYGGAGNDLVWGDSMALITTTVTRGVGVTTSDWNYSHDDAEDAIERFATLTDSADYWLALQGGGHCAVSDADEIYGGDGDDILFGQAGDDKLRGESGNDWLVGGDGQDNIDGGYGSDRTSSGNDSSSTLRGAVAARLISWKESFKSFGLPYNPFGGLNLGKGKPSDGSFDFLTFDTRASRNDD
jgi:Ca2+-binding RTX toxin-like protein